MTRPFTPCFSAARRPTYARWLNDLSFRPPMSVTRHALKLDLCAADADPPRMTANRDARSTVATARAANVSQRFLTWMNPPLWSFWGIRPADPIPVPAPGKGSLFDRRGDDAVELVLGHEHAAWLGA